MGEEMEMDCRSLELKLKKKEREIRRLEITNKILLNLHEQANRFRDFSEQTARQKIFYSEMVLENSPSISIMLDMELNTVLATDSFYQKTFYPKHNIDSGVYVGEVFEKFCRLRVWSTF